MNTFPEPFVASPITKNFILDLLAQEIACLKFDRGIVATISYSSPPWNINSLELKSLCFTNSVKSNPYGILFTRISTLLCVASS